MHQKESDMSELEDCPFCKTVINPGADTCTGCNATARIVTTGSLTGKIVRLIYFIPALFIMILSFSLYFFDKKDPQLHVVWLIMFIASCPFVYSGRNIFKPKRSERLWFPFEVTVHNHNTYRRF
jgi:hypothetical protein